MCEKPTIAELSVEWVRGADRPAPSNANSHTLMLLNRTAKRNLWCATNWQEKAPPERGEVLGLRNVGSQPGGLSERPPALARSRGHVTPSDHPTDKSDSTSLS